VTALSVGKDLDGRYTLTYWYVLELTNRGDAPARLAMVSSGKSTPEPERVLQPRTEPSRRI
jgi:hypothetical protein